MCIRDRYQETECDAIVEEVKQEMDEALNHARNAADPGADEMYEDVFDPQTKNRSRWILESENHFIYPRPDP